MKLKTLQETNSFRNSKWYNSKHRDSFEGVFSCDGKGFDSLEGVPSNVTGSFFCNRNKLTDLVGAPTTIGRNFYCSQNNLTSLKGCPAEIPFSFDCSVNNLTTLEFAPKCQILICDSNRLTSLKGAPSYVRTFSCNYNKLTSLEYAPTHALESFICKNNKISSLIGVDDILENVGVFYCGDNPIREGGLGLLLIPKISKLVFDNGERTNLAFAIIANYISVNAAELIYECQRELIEAGLEEFAQI